VRGVIDDLARVLADLEDLLADAVRGVVRDLAAGDVDLERLGDVIAAALEVAMFRRELAHAERVLAAA
jgi:hypothetical protein